MKLSAKYLAGMAAFFGVGLGVTLAQMVPQAKQITSQSGQTSQAGRRTTSHKKRQVKKPSIAPPVAAPAVIAQPVQAPPLRPSQMPAVPPRVSYSNGQLTVVAENSTLGDVLNAIHNVAGTQIETVGGGAGERVAAKIGPGSVREVLLSILQGSRYDYILLGSANNPDQIERVILTPRTGGTTGGAANASARGSAPVGAAPRQAAPDDEVDEDGAEGFATPRPGQQVPGQPNAAQPAPNGQSPTVPSQNVKTPEQLLEDLKRMEQERRSQQPGAQDPRQRGDRPPD